MQVHAEEEWELGLAFSDGHTRHGRALLSSSHKYAVCPAGTDIQQVEYLVGQGPSCILGKRRLQNKMPRPSGETSVSSRTFTHIWTKFGW